MIYNWHIKQYIILTPGEEYCNGCQGKGIVKIMKLPNDPHSKPLICSKCYGEGVLDWIEKAMGKLRKRPSQSIPPRQRLVGGI